MTVLKSSLIAADPPIKTQLHTPIYSYNTTALIGLLGYRSRFYKGLFTFSQVYLHLVLSWFFFLFFKQMENSEGRLSYWHNIGNGSTAALNNSHYSTIRTFSLGLRGNKETGGSSSALWNFLTLLPSAVVNAITWEVKGHWFQRSQSRRASGQFWTLAVEKTGFWLHVVADLVLTLLCIHWKKPQ